ncbi:helix-hairpin-helix domain-containing protein [Sphingobacterium sp. N143]|uniref:ComEA family DNA-binding protein n=1 Tax=Sphingobacterium sp. N143 TaxID=2746727 RepID=UPI00257887B9|nr:helix-hairpin-helix domain-containing protein [Sphingobacterium sp. N143]MDM1296383.1 helix-hairpin-helix domain-containing protein [Sphingobacterium sp. N143]
MKRLLTYFKFSKTEQNGFFIILVIIILFIVLYTIITKQRTGDPIPNQVKVFEQSFHDSTEIIDSPNKKYINEKVNVEKKNNIHKKRPTIDSEDAKLFYFNPNNLSVTEWRKLGLSDKQITVIKNYEKKGGSFKVKEDLKKVYSINSRLYKKLEPYINIKPVVEKTIEKAPMLYDKYETNKSELIDVNTCDTVALMRLKGIGTILSKRILKYRDVLGGFYRIEQLKEVYGVSVETYEMIKDEIVVSNVDGVKKININQIDANSLAKHPYLSPKDAKLIINYRDQHGNYANIEDLAKIGTLSDLAIAKIAPYLIFENDSR